MRIRFQDGSVATLTPDSSAKVEQTDSGLVFRLVAGSMSFLGAPGSSMSVFSGQTAVQAVANVATAVTAPGSGPSAGSRGTTSGLVGISTPAPISLSRK